MSRATFILSSVDNAKRNRKTDKTWNLIPSRLILFQADGLLKFISMTMKHSPVEQDVEST